MVPRLIIDTTVTGRTEVGAEEEERLDEANAETVAL